MTVTSVNGKTGDVILNPEDVGAAPVSSIPSFQFKLPSGSTSTNTVDQALQDFIDQVDAAGGGNITLTNSGGIYWLGKQIKLTYRTGLISNAGVWFQTTGFNAGYEDVGDYSAHFANFPGGYAFTINAAYNPDGTLSGTWAQQFPTLQGCEFRNVNVRQHAGHTVCPTHMLYVCAPHIVANCSTFYLHNLVIVPGVYMDNLHVEQTIAYIPFVDERYSLRDMRRYRRWVVLSNTGDYIHLNNVHANVRLSKNRGAVITNGSGIIWLDESIAVKIHGRHDENDFDWIVAKNSTFTYEDSHQWIGTSPKVWLGNRSHAIIRNVDFEWVSNDDHQQFLTPGNEICLDITSSLKTENVRRVRTVIGNVGVKVRTGINTSKWNKASDELGPPTVPVFVRPENLSEFTKWNLYSHLLSASGKVDTGFRVQLNHSLVDIPHGSNTANNSLGVSLSTVESTIIPWSKTGQTGAVKYYYRPIAIVDWNRRFLYNTNAGTFNSQGTVVDVANGELKNVILNYNPNNGYGMGVDSENGFTPMLLAIVRTPYTVGTDFVQNTQLYPDIVFIPIFEPADGVMLVDNGDYCNGFKWQPFNKVIPTTFKLKSATWAGEKFTGVIPATQTRPTNQAGVDSPIGINGDVLLFDSPTDAETDTGYLGFIKTSNNTVANRQWRRFGAIVTD